MVKIAQVAMLHGTKLRPNERIKDSMNFLCFSKTKNGTGSHRRFPSLINRCFTLQKQKRQITLHWLNACIFLLILPQYAECVGSPNKRVPEPSRAKHEARCEIHRISRLYKRKLKGDYHLSYQKKKLKGD